jgi:hypothetical protein
MILRKMVLSCLACMVLSSVAWAQVPPAAPAAAAAATPVAGAAVAAAPAPNFCEQCLAACESCKRKLCEMPLGAMLNSMTKPMSGLSGGIIPNFCPVTPSKEDLAKPGVEGAAAQAKADALAAKARRQGVRYLGTMDCRYYPEAEGALIAALRTDGVECVRWEAAMALGRACCCNRNVMNALTISVNGSEADGHPAELSERVRMAAAVALDRCLACYVEVVETAPVPVVDPLQEKKPQGERAPPPAPLPPAAAKSRRPDAQTVAAARGALKKFYGHYGVAEPAKETVLSVRVTPVPATPVQTTQAPAKMTPPATKQAALPTTPAIKQASMPAPAMPAATTPVPSMPRAVVAPTRREPRSLFGVIKEAMGGSSTRVAPQPPSTTVIYDHPTQAAMAVQPPPEMPPTKVMPNAMAAAKVQPNPTPAPVVTPASATQPAGTTIIFDPPASSTPKK